MKICQETETLVKIRQKCRAVYMKTQVRFLSLAATYVVQQ